MGLKQRTTILFCLSQTEQSGFLSHSFSLFGDRLPAIKWEKKMKSVGGFLVWQKKLWGKMEKCIK